jgi:antitoxin (DNA-binding transcriptional repressor) of toxin-antitoxin stability system
MRAVGIKTLKNKLSEYVRLAAAGETVLISDRDRVVAQLGPPGRTEAVRMPILFWLMRSAKGWSRLRRCRRASRLRRRRA